MKTNIKIIVALIVGVALSTTLSYVLAETILDSKNVYYKDNSGLAVNNVQDAIDGTCKRFEEKVDTFLDKVYPVGSIYISYSSTNPADFFGGEWVVYGDGRVLKGISSGEAGKTGGSSTTTLTMSNIPAHTHTYDKVNANTGSHTLTIAEMPSHNHIQKSYWMAVDFGTTPPEEWGARLAVGDSNVKTTETSALYNLLKSEGGNQGHTHPISTTSTNTGSAGSTSPSAISVEDPYITVYMWRRTA